MLNRVLLVIACRAVDARSSEEVGALHGLPAFPLCLLEEEGAREENDVLRS